MPVIKQADLSIELPSNIDLDQIVKTLKSDKKVTAGKGIFILPIDIGATKMVPYEVSNYTDYLISDALIEQVLTAMLPMANT